MACNEYGPGRLAEPPEILAAIQALLATPKPLAGRHALVTSGPTHEPIDPVRYIANRSSGRQGHAIATALAGGGARHPHRRPGRPGGPARRHHPPRGNRRRDAGSLRSRPARGYRRLRRRRRGLAHGPSRRTQVEEGPGRGRPRTGSGPQSGHPRHHRRRRPGPAKLSGRVGFRRRNLENLAAHAAGKAAPQGHATGSSCCQRRLCPPAALKRAGGTPRTRCIWSRRRTSKIGHAPARKKSPGALPAVSRSVLHEYSRHRHTPAARRGP